MWRSGNFTHTQFTQSQDTSHPSYPIPRCFTLNSRTPTLRLEILWILLETLSPVSIPSPMMLIDKWIFQKLETKLLSQQLKCILVLIFFEHCRDLFCTLSHSSDPKYNETMQLFQGGFQKEELSSVRAKYKRKADCRIHSDRGLSSGNNQNSIDDDFSIQLNLMLCSNLLFRPLARMCRWLTNRARTRLA